MYRIHEDICSFQHRLEAESMARREERAGRTLNDKTKADKTRMMIPAATAVRTMILVEYEYGMIVVNPGGAVEGSAAVGLAAVVSVTIVPRYHTEEQGIRGIATNIHGSSKQAEALASPKLA